MRTRIDLISSGTIDLSDDVIYSLNYSIADIRQPENRDASYSKTIKIPGSKNNDNLFKYIFEIDIDCNFNPNIKAECIIYIDELPQLRGYLQMLRIYRNDENSIEYEVTIRGQVANIFTEWGDKELTDINWSDLDHYYLKSNIMASWSVLQGDGYMYPLIDLGKTNGAEYHVEDFAPAIYVREYLVRMFALAGYTWSSAFLNDKILFKHLIIPFNQQALLLKESQTTPRFFEAQLTVPQTVLAAGQLFGDWIKFNTDVSDVSSQYDTGTYRWTVYKTGYYNIYSQLTTQATPSDEFVYLRIAKYLGGNPDDYGSYTMLSDAFTAIDSAVAQDIYVSALNVKLYAGDVVIVAMVGVSGQNTDITNGYFWNEVVNSGLCDGDYLYMENAIPKKVKIKDFFKSIIQMFNLYIDEDKNTTKQLNIEPRDDFYSGGTTIDWTSKLDTSKELVLLPMGALDANQYRYKYKEDSDYWNKKCQDAHGQTYSEFKKVITNDFLKNTNLTEVIFSATPSVQVGGTDRIIPQIINVNSAGNIGTMNGFNIRIIQFTDGAKTTNNPYTFKSLVEGDTTETVYPLSGMPNIPLTPSYALDFGVPLELFYNTTQYTNNNLFNKYYKKFIDEITDKDSKIVIGWFALTPKDILTLDFRNQFFVDGHLLRLNKIYDYNPVISQVTKCEFIRIKYADIFVGQTINILGSDLEYADGTPTPQPTNPNLPQHLNNNLVSTNDNRVSATARNVIVTGTRNYVGDNATDITILSSSGVVVMPNLRGVTVLNSSGVIVTDSGVTYINNQQITGGIPTLAEVLAAGSIMDVATTIQNSDGSGAFGLYDLNALLTHSIEVDIQGVYKIAISSPRVKLTQQTANGMLVLDSNKEIQSIGFSSGTIYTPTLTNAANLSASTAYSCQYFRIGNVVTVSGKVDVDPVTPATLTQLGISLPIASNFSAAEQCGGTAFASGIAGQGAAIRCDATNDRAEMVWIAGDITNQPMYFTFTYRII